MMRWTLAFALGWLHACAGLKDARDLCAGAFLPIHDAQGPGAASPRAGERVRIRGHVVADFQAADRLGGFFLQEARPDGDARTSEGIFVHAPGAGDVAVGDLVSLSGRIEEASGLTQLTDVEELAVCRPAAAPEPTPLALAETRDLEPYEGMLVAIAGELTVAGSHELGDHGRLLLAAGGRPFKHAPGDAPRLLLDDGSHVENPSPPPYLGAAGTRRVGDAVAGLVGVISEDERGHVLHPTTPPRFSARNPRPAAPAVGGTVRIANFNLLNFFTTLGERGASDARELERQRAKHVAAIAGLGAHVVGLNELENNGEDAIRDLVEALNASAPDGETGRWAHVSDPPGGLGDDAIRVGLIYRPAAVRPVGPPQADRDPVFKRPPLAQTFEARGERFTVVVNHFKSKSCRAAEGPEADAGDGQGCWNPLRVRQARRLLEFVAHLQAESGDADVVVIGDLNAYGGEDPIRALTGGGLIDQVAVHVPAAERYSYVFRGEAGYLDHALTTPGLDGRVTGAAFWHINADEPPVLDYNTERRHPGLYRPDPYRSSDHDPVLIGLDLSP